MPTYLSKEGLETLKAELQQRKTTTRFEIADRIASAKELGDLSENFEYHEAKETQAQNEMRILDLENMVKDTVMVEQQSGGNIIELGTTFTISVGGKERKFEIVGSNEADPSAGKISNESPLGQAFIGRGEGEVVEISVPSGTMTYKIISIQ